MLPFCFLGSRWLCALPLNSRISWVLSTKSMIPYAWWAIGSIVLKWRMHVTDGPPCRPWCWWIFKVLQTKWRSMNDSFFFFFLLLKSLLFPSFCFPVDQLFTITQLPSLVTGVSATLLSTNSSSKNHYCKSGRQIWKQTNKRGRHVFFRLKSIVVYHSPTMDVVSSEYHVSAAL